MRARKLAVAVRALVLALVSMFEWSESAQAVEAKNSTEAKAVAAAENAPPRVDITIVGDLGNAAELGARITSWFHGAAGHASSSAQKSLEPSTVFAPTAEIGVRAWVVVRSAASARLVFAVQEHASDAPRYLVNDVTLDTGLDELGMEHLAQVAYLSAMALWAGDAESARKDVEESLREVQPSRPKLAPTPNVPVKRVSDADRPRASFRLGLELADRFGDEGLPARYALALSVFRARESSVLGVALHLEIAAPTAADHSGLDLAFSGESARLGVLFERQIYGTYWYSLELGPGVDVVRYHATSEAGSTLEPTAGGRDMRAALYASASTRWKFHYFSIQGGILALVPLQQTHYDISEPNGSRAILTSWPVQPEIFSGVYW